jgi:hypothetical protein
MFLMYLNINLLHVGILCWENNHKLLGVSYRVILVMRRLEQ